LKLTGTVTVSKYGEELIRKGELNVYNKWIINREGELIQGNIVKVLNEKGNLIGYGFYENIGAIGVRILSREEINLDEILSRIYNAYKFRIDKLKLKSFYRLVNSDGDLLPGLIIDAYENIAVIQSSSIGFDKILYKIAEMLINKLNFKTIYVKNDQRSRIEAGLRVWKKIIMGEKRTRTIINEGNVKFHVDVENGQKTGFFIDQRPNRIELEKYVESNMKVLDLYSYTGGFGIHAAIKGAKVVMIEESEYAVNEAIRNIKLNNVEDKCKVIKCRVEDYMTTCKDKFNIVICDPPALIQKIEDKRRGKRAYLKLYESTMKILERDGLLIASSCSHFISRNEFLDLIWKASIKAGRKVKLIGEVRGASPCHVARPRDKHLMYLKVAFLQVE